jgi:hypothetical protein
MKTASLEFGALAAPITEQLSRQGIALNGGEAIDLDAHAIARLYVRGVLTESETTKAWKRLRANVLRSIRLTPTSTAPNN